MASDPTIPKLAAYKGKGRRWLTTWYDRQGIRRLRSLGWEHNTPRSQAIARWEQLKRELKSHPERQTPGGEEAQFTLARLAGRYLRHASRTYRKNGKPTSHVGNVRYAMRALRDEGAGESANAFNAPRMAGLRDRMVLRDIVAGETEARPRALKTVNTRLQIIKDAFAWARERGYITAETASDVRSVRRLRKGRSEAINPRKITGVDRSVVDATVASLPPVVRDMVELLWIQGCRPQEICSMRGCELETTGEIWLYRPRHKLEHLEGDTETIRCVGPRAQKIIRRYLKPDLTAYLFSPREAHAQRLASQRKLRADGKLKTPLYPSHAKRERTGPGGRIGDHYTTESLRRTIHYACRRAGIVSWNPNQLRHAVATRLRKQYGLEDASVQLGHASLATTEIYAEKDIQRAMQIAREVG